MSSKSGTQQQTHWRSVIVAGVVWLLSAVEDNIIGVSEWPYMHTIDEKATTSFFGVASAMSYVGHAIFALLFAVWRHKFGTTRMPLIAGRLISLLGCLLYLGVEILPENRRFLMMACYFLFGAGFGSMSTIRGYIVEVSHEDDRARACAVTTAANLFAIVLGPVVQLIFSGKTFQYPGKEIIKGKIRFNMFSAPVWFALGLNIAAILVLATIFRDNKQKRRFKTTHKYGVIRRTWHKLRAADIVWPVVALCLFEVAVNRLTNVTIGTVVAPLFMAGYGWSSVKTIVVLSIGQSGVGLLCIAIAALFIFAKLGRKIHPRVYGLAGIAVAVAMYLAVYPWPNTSRLPAAFNETANAGCDPAEYAWCKKPIPTPPVLITGLIAVMGLGLPLISIALDTVYSKVQGDIDQSTMQGVFMVTEEVTHCIGAIYSASIFSSSGVSTLWIVNGSIVISGAVLWLLFFRKLAPFQ